MASFQDNFDYPTNQLSADWNIVTSGGFIRTWSTSPSNNGMLVPQNAVASAPGIILNKTTVGDNVVVLAEYYKMGGNDTSNGVYNSLLLRYVDSSDFLALKIESSNSNFDSRGVYLQPNSIEVANHTNFEVTMYNADGLPLADEIAPNKTNIPTDGIVEVNMSGDVYDITIYESNGDFAASGSSTIAGHDTTPSYIGFGHAAEWDANIDGWGGISATDGFITPQAPTIDSFSATSYSIIEGNSSTLGWSVSSGSDVTSVYIDNGVGNVGLNGTSAVTPLSATTYSISAWNSVGSDTDSLYIDVFAELPVITSFTNDGPILSGTSATVSWTTSASTSAFIDNGIGWLSPSTVSAGNFTSAFDVTTTYTMSAYDDDLSVDVASTTVTVALDPTVTLSIIGGPVCSGTPYTIEWNTTNSVSAYIDNGIGWVSPVSAGSVSASSVYPVNYSISAYNALSGEATDSEFIQVYYSTPVASAGPDIYVSATGGPAVVQFNGSQSYDPQSLPITYAWTIDGTPASTDPVFNTILSGGTYLAELTVINSCGNSATDTVTAYVSATEAPVAIANATPQFMTSTGLVELDGSSSYDTDGSIVSYVWDLEGTTIGLVPTFDYLISSYGTYNFNLTVTDDDGLIGTDTVTVIASSDFNPSANAGPDQKYCISSGGDVDVYLDGSGSLPQDGTASFEIVWYNWDLSDFGVSDVSGTVSATHEISATIPSVSGGNYTAGLTVSANSTGTAIDFIDVDVHYKPVVTTYANDVTLPVGGSQASVTLSAYSSQPNDEYQWNIDTGGGSPIVLLEQFPTVNVPVGGYSASAKALNTDTGCYSDIDVVTFDVYPPSLQIIDFTLTPDYVIGYPSSSVPVTLEWVISGATGADIDNGIGSVSPTSGTIPLDLIAGTYAFTLSAYDGVDVITETVYGTYDTLYTSAGLPVDLEVCKQKEDYIKTYGVDEIRYGINRDINLVEYLPEYVQRTETKLLVEKFQCYLNNIFSGQKNYSLDENLLDIVTCSSSACGTSAVDNRYTYDNVSGDVLTPTYKPVGEVFIKDICNVPDESTCREGLDAENNPIVDELFNNDRISILDKIFRITDMFDPDLIPIELIQFYAENLGYSVGINREAITTVTDDPRAVEFEQKRYLRFMVRNLPTWYQLKTNRSSIKIMLYSFGLVGTFVYYYTKNYCDTSDANYQDVFGQNPPFKCLTNNTGEHEDDGTGTDSTDSTACDGITSYDSDNITPEDIAKLRCCLITNNIVYNENAFDDAIDKANNDTSNDWVLTRNDSSSVFENLDNPKITDEYFATPHFRLWIDLLDSQGNYSVDEDRQRMISEAINAVKPINTVFDGVSVYFDSGVNTVYATSYVRMRKSIKVYATC